MADLDLPCWCSWAPAPSSHCWVCGGRRTSGLGCSGTSPWWVGGCRRVWSRRPADTNQTNQINNLRWKPSTDWVETYVISFPYRQIAQIFDGAGNIWCFPLDADDSFSRPLHEVGPREGPGGVGRHVVVELAQVVARPPGWPAWHNRPVVTDCSSEQSNVFPHRLTENWAELSSPRLAVSQARGGSQQYSSSRPEIEPDL